MKEKGADGWAKENLRAWPKANGWEEGIGGTIVVEGKGRGLVTVRDKLVLLHEDFLLPSRSPTLLFCTVKSCANCLLRTSILLFSLSMIFYLDIKTRVKYCVTYPSFRSRTRIHFPFSANSRDFSRLSHRSSLSPIEKCPSVEPSSELIICWRVYLRLGTSIIRLLASPLLLTFILFLSSSLCLFTSTQHSPHPLITY